MVHDFNRHPEGNPNVGRAAWQLAPRKMHNGEYPLNPHCSFYPKYTPKGQNAWTKGEDPVTCETVYNLKPVYAYPETRVFLKQSEGDSGQWQVWVTSLDGEYSWVSPKTYINLRYAKQQAMEFRYQWDCLVVAMADIPDTEYAVGERVQCCNGSEYPHAQLGYCMGTVVNANISAAWVTVKFDSHVETLGNTFDIRVDHIYSLAPVTFKILAVANEHDIFGGDDYKHAKAKFDRFGTNQKDAAAILENVTGEKVAAILHNQRTAYPPTPLNRWHIEGYDKDGMLTTNHDGESWARHFVQFMHPIGGIRRAIAGAIYSGSAVKVIAHKSGKVNGKVMARVLWSDQYTPVPASYGETASYDENELRLPDHVDVNTGWVFTWVELTGNKSYFTHNKSDIRVAWEETDAHRNDNDTASRGVWIEKWLIHDGELPYNRLLTGSKQYLTYEQAQRRIVELDQ